LHQLGTQVYTCNEQYNRQQLQIIGVSGSVLNQNINMAKKVFLNRESAIPTVQVPSVRREEPDSSSRNSLVSVTTGQLPFSILDETSKSFPKFNATGCSILINFNSTGEGDELTKYLKECITVLTDYIVDQMPDRDLVGLRIRNTKNVQDKVVGISLRRRDQLKPDVVWSVLRKVI
jgi:DNA-binding transcriptional regulator YdaS (Cro superfamily)